MSDDSNPGYKHPPKAGQFKPGQSGNLRGRPKGSRNLKTDLNKMMRKRIVLTEKGKTRQISGQEAVLLSLLKRVMEGDVRAANSILTMVMKLNPPEPLDDGNEEISDSDRAIIEDYLNRHIDPETGQ